MSKWNTNNLHSMPDDDEKNVERDLNNNKFTNGAFFPIRQLINNDLNKPKLKMNSSASTHLYENSYLDSFLIDLEDNLREKVFFTLDKPIVLKIIDHEQESSLVVLHRTVYIIRIIYNGYDWTIRKRFKNFLKLYETYALFKAKQNLKNIAHLHTSHTSSSPPQTPLNTTTPDKYIFVLIHFF